MDIYKNPVTYRAHKEFIDIRAYNFSKLLSGNKETVALKIKQGYSYRHA
jgi:hypothetical protein